MLQLRGPGPAERHVDAVAACRRSRLRPAAGATMSNGTSTRLRVLGPLADRRARSACSVRPRRRTIERQRKFARNPSSFQTNLSFSQTRFRHACSRSVRSKPCGSGCLRDRRSSACTRRNCAPLLRDAHAAAGPHPTVKLAGKLATTSTRNGSATSPAACVVFLDRLELVAQIFLDHVFHLLGEVGQPLLDLLRLRSRCGWRPAVRRNRPGA